MAARPYEASVMMRQDTTWNGPFHDLQKVWPLCAFSIHYGRSDAQVFL